jgi:hypothetical protein
MGMGKIRKIRKKESRYSKKHVSPTIGAPHRHVVLIFF